MNSIISAIRQPLVLLDQELRVVSANPAFYRNFAVMPEETVGLHLAAVGDRFLGVPALNGFFNLLQGGNSSIGDYEIEIDAPAFGKRVLLLSADKIQSERAKIGNIIVSIDDITERRQMETVLKSAKWHAERSNLNKSRFLAAASHDLRHSLQTLSIVRGVLAKEIVKKSEGDALKLVATLDETAGALAGMLDTLLDINQLDAGLVEPEKINFPVSDLLERLRDEFAHHSRARSLVWRVVPCRLTIWSDPRLLEQMIRNLLSNAVNYTERGKMLLGCRRRGDKLRIEVWDTGPGISEGPLRTDFTEFHLLEGPVRECSGGLGRGLSIVHRLGRLLDHKIEVHSRPHIGSLFAVEVPLGRGQPGALVQRNRRADRPNTNRDAAILVVEADPLVREMLVRLFGSEGYRTLAAADGLRARALAQGSTRPDLVVADYGPQHGLTGLELVAGVREAFGREIPAVILTGDISINTAREITRRGCTQRNKPVKAQELTCLIQTLLAESTRSIEGTGFPPQIDSKDDAKRPFVFVVDDDKSVRDAMRDLLREEGWAVEVHSSGEEFLESYRRGSGGCLIVDARMPRMGGPELLERLKLEGGGPAAIMIADRADVRVAVRAMKAGAMAFLEKPIEYDELFVNIERALDLTRNSVALSSLRESAARKISGLTARERQVVDMVVTGNPNKQIAYVLGISQRTVETHRATAMKKIGVRTLSELIHLTIVSSQRDS